MAAPGVGAEGLGNRLQHEVGDEARHDLADVHAFVEALRDLHGAVGREPELAHRLLLQGGGGERRRRRNGAIRGSVPGRLEKKHGARQRRVIRMALERAGAAPPAARSPTPRTIAKRAWMNATPAMIPLAASRAASRFATSTVHT